MSYDIIIIGGGPAGLSCAIYTTRYKLKTLVLSKVFGGEILDSYSVENYPGFQKITGPDLMDKWQNQAKSFGAELKEEEVLDISKKNKMFEVKTGKAIYQAKTIVVAIGSNRRKLGVKGEEEFSGRGVTYCSTCDAPFFKDKTVAVVGGGDSAALSVLLLTEYAKKVYMVYRGSKDKIRAEPFRMEKIYAHPKCEVILNSSITEIYGEGVVKGVKLNKKSDLKLDGVFIEIGFDPNTQILEKLGAKVDLSGFVIVNKDQSTGVDGVFAAGDSTTATNKFKQAICAAAEGAIAAESVYTFLEKQK